MTPFLMGAAVLVVVLVGVFLAQAARIAHDRSDRFWGTLSFQTPSGVAFESLEGLSEYSDAVVLGRIVGIDKGRVFGELEPEAPDPEEGRVHYLTARLDVERLLRGELVPGSERQLKLELPMPNEDKFQELAANAPSERGVYFLFNAGHSAAQNNLSKQRQEADREYYALVAVGAQAREMDGKVHGLGNPDLDFLEQYEGDAFGGFVEQVAALR
ncbi:MAG: hypothetical protein H0X16_11895 [Chloroflexi bacterium]|nr:hypothetical protein [Chloroflexota bacterium]